MWLKFYSTLRQGKNYSEIWPLQPDLNSLFPENKIIQLTALGFKYLPFLALATAVVQYSLLDSGFVPQILAMLLFLLSLPFHGWYWLGIRARTPLPPGINAWYQQVRQRMQTQGVQLQPSSEQSGHYIYLDLANLLKQAYQQLDKAFIREWL